MKIMAFQARQSPQTIKALLERVDEFDGFWLTVIEARQIRIGA